MFLATVTPKPAIFENLISFAEFHPTKLKLGVFVGSTTIENGGEGGI